MQFGGGAVYGRFFLALRAMDMEARSLTQFVTLSENNSGKMAEDLFGVPNLTTETIRCQCPP